MSYILEALKKAESERNPTLLSAPAASPAFAGSFQPHPAKRRKPWQWIALPALTIVLLGVAWLGARQVYMPPASEPMDSRAALPATKGEAALTGVQSETPLALARLPEHSTSLEPAPKPVKPKEDPPQKTPVKKPPAVKDPPKAVKPSPPAPDETPIATLNELPAQIQQEIPTLAVGGYIYANNKAERSILINNRLLREGDEVAPGLKLEKMMRNGMVLNYKGYRYQASY